MFLAGMSRLISSAQSFSREQLGFDKKKKKKNNSCHSASVNVSVRPKHSFTFYPIACGSLSFSVP